MNKDNNVIKDEKIRTECGDTSVFESYSYELCKLKSAQKLSLSPDRLRKRSSKKIRNDPASININKNSSIEVRTLCEASTQALLVDSDTSVQVATQELTPPVYFKPKRLMVAANYLLGTVLSFLVAYYFTTQF